MKIHSRFKDYYDYLTKVYGEDPLVNWERNLLSETQDVFTLKNIANLDPNGWVGTKWGYWATHHECMLLIVAGRRFLLYKKKPSPDELLPKQWTALTPDSPDALKLNGFNHWSKKWQKVSPESIKRYTGMYTDEAMNLCIRFQSPILWINVDYRESTIIPSGPVLSEVHGLPGLYPAEQIFQDISDFWLNRAKGSPDADPPVEVDDKIKILNHGFDKTSFRPGLRK